MSYESMWRDEVRCDFPGCGDDFDTAKNARVAIVVDGKIMAFCSKHSRRLAEEGISLRVLSEIHQELREILERLQGERRRMEREARERVFIQELKSKI